MQPRKLTVIRLPRFLSLIVGVAALLSVPAAAQAAKIRASEPCYANGEVATITGQGFAPNGPISFTVNGRRIDANVTTNGDGEFSAEYTPQSTQTETRLVIRATDSDETSARTALFVTRERSVTAKPSTTDNVRTWKAVFKLFGFGEGNVFIHYVSPKGKMRKNVKLGALQGPCGRLKTEKRRVLPFKDPAYGIWKLQFDTRRRYSPETAKKRVIPVKVFRG